MATALSNKGRADVDLINDIADCACDPLRYVLYAYPWGEGDLKRSVGPRNWQREILVAISEHLSAPQTRTTPLKIAVASGHGIGKSALISWIVGWGLSTCKNTKIVITANTDTQLRTKTWPELTKWLNLSINKHWFNITKTAIYINDKKNTDSWRCDAIPWSVHNTQAFAGLHNEGSRIIMIFDEAAGIDDKVWEVAEGALTDADTEIIFIAFSNPSKNTGRFRECFSKFSHRWVTKQIDSRTVEGINLSEIKKWEEDWGEDSDYFKVRVRGEFPNIGVNEFINAQDVEKCRRYNAIGYETLPKIIAMDVARFGDDRTVIGMRQGRKFTILGQYRGLDTVQSAERLIEQIEHHNPDAVIIDGDGLGAGVVDQVKSRNYDVRKGKKILYEHHGAATSENPNKYLNKRVECWDKMREAIRVELDLPNVPEIVDDLCNISYSFNAKNQMVLEAKKDLKARGLPSPDIGDTLAMTYAIKIAPNSKQNTFVSEYNRVNMYDWGGGSWMGG